ncbi:hypothetical protein [Ferrovum sp.]|uniref:hypothetical protein n=1 Tax=Ferrovum sp. TaxID=2609467 RepID=UPI00341AA38E
MDKTYLRGSLPEKAAAYLSRVWPELRIYPAGVKVVEHHQDGRPHMHVLILPAKSRHRHATIITLTQPQQ